MSLKLIKTAPGRVETTPRTKGMEKPRRCGVCQITKPAKQFEVNREVCNECRKQP